MRPTDRPTEKTLPGGVRTSGVNTIKNISLSPTKRQNKLACLPLENRFILASYLQISPGAYSSLARDKHSSLLRLFVTTKKVLITLTPGVNAIKISLLLMTRPNKLECLCLAITFQSSLTFAGNTRSLPKKEAFEMCSGWLWPCPQILRPDWKGFPRANLLAYWASLSVTKEKSFDNVDPRRTNSARTSSPSPRRPSCSAGRWYFPSAKNFLPSDRRKRPTVSESACLKSTRCQAYEHFMCITYDCRKIS